MFLVYGFFVSKNLVLQAGSEKLVFNTEQGHQATKQY